MKISATIAATCALATAATVGSWRLRHPLPEGVAGGVAAVLQGKLLYAGGTTWRGGEKLWLSMVRVFDPASDQWSTGPDLPEPLAYGPAVITDGGWEILGGINARGSSYNIWRLDARQRLWQKTGALTFPTALASAGVARNHVYVFGGCPDVASLADCTTGVMARSEKGGWIEVSRLPDGPTALAASAVVNEHIYLFGGCQSTGPASIRNVDTAWRYDPDSRSWHSLRALPRAARAMSALALEGGSILLAGGYHATAEEAREHSPEYGFSALAWLYHPDRDTYEPVTALPQGVAGLAFASAGRTVYGIGGEDRPRSRSAALIETHLR